MKRRELYALATLGAFSAFLLFFGLGAFGLVGADEPRYAQIAREMLARGDWVVPVLNGNPWLEKPVLYYWEAMIAYRLFGVHDWTARLPSAFSAATLGLAVYGFWRSEQKHLSGRSSPDNGGSAASSGVSPLDAALITLSSAAVIGFGRGASTDMPMAANFAVAMLGWAAWYRGRRRAALLVFFVFLALATLAKGPVAPGLAAMIVVPFAVLRRRPALLRETLWWPGVAAFALVAVPWFWLVQARTGTFLRVFFLEHNLERFGTPVFRHVQPFWYYLPVLLLALLPWTVWCCAGFWRALRRAAPFPRLGWRRQGGPVHDADLPVSAVDAPDRALEIFLAVWAVVPVVFFSFSQSKLPGYILPAVPAWTLLAARWIEDQQRAHENPHPPANQPQAARFQLLLFLHAAACAIVLGAVILAPYAVARVSATGTAKAVAAVAAAVIFSAIVLSVRRHGPRVLRFVTLVPVVLSVAFILRIAGAAIDATQSARPLARELARIESRPARLAVLHVKRETEYGLNFYRNQQIASYDRAEIPAEDHLVVARGGARDELAELAGGRRVVRLGEYPPQRLEFYWITRQAGHQH